MKIGVLCLLSFWTHVASFVLDASYFNGYWSRISKDRQFKCQQRCPILGQQASSGDDDVSSSIAAAYSPGELTFRSTNDTTAVRFGDVCVPATPKRRVQQNSVDEYRLPTSSTISRINENDEETRAAASRRNNWMIAIASVTFSAMNWFWQYSHPISPVQLLYSMQQNSEPMSVVGMNQKPTVVDFWAPWCENCQLIAPTLRQLEEEYKDRVNFVMVDGDKVSSWPYVEAFRVDAIPHLALVNADGSIETALIGPVPKHVLKADLNVLLENAKNQRGNNKNEEKLPLPYRMLDVFANDPENRRVRFQ